MRVLMQPHLRHFRSEESGIKRVVEAYFTYLPEYGVTLVDEGQSYDLKAVHAGMERGGDVAHCHGLYWTADYAAAAWEYRANREVTHSLREAKAITVPSAWVGETIRRDMRRIPTVVGHGIDWKAWQHEIPNQGYVLWNKNRKEDVCDPADLLPLAQRYHSIKFVTTFAPEPKTPNIKPIGVIPHDQMKQLVQGAAVYLSTTKETFGIGVLEAMASGVPVLGYAHGGNLELVQHGVNGYLAPPGDTEALVEGLGYCWKYRDILGENGRQLARDFTWQRACEQVAAVYERVMQPREVRVTVVIPSYNYADKVGRALEHVASQTFLDFECIVVDDGSTDGSAELIPTLLPDERFRYVHQENKGVAHARNRGIQEGSAEYVCCLDADDAIGPEFLAKCVDALEADRNLGIAYTGLRYFLPDGRTGVSQWPGEWDFDRQLQRQNQVPTCCVYRREMWEALGGYRQRYAPLGAGSEDAEFWTRAGAYGWAAAKVTEEPLFLYSWQSGRVSGNPDYQEPDWLAWHPWVTDNLHPFASHARPKRFSHPVRQYDQPVVSVVVPVGPGHEDVVWDALDSLDAQHYRTWEGIVVWDTGEPIPQNVQRAFPHLRWIQSEEAPMGAGAARNAGAAVARGPFLLFLDADDWLYPRAIQKMMDAWAAENAIVYSDYVGRAFIGDESELAPDLQKRILWRNDDGETAIEYHAQDYEPARAQRQPEGDTPWIWCNITSLVPAAWHQEVSGFDETLESWEDVDYWWRLAKAGKCFARIDEPLLVYRFYSGGRRDRGWEQHPTLLRQLRAKHEEIDTMPCTGCGNRKSTPRAAAGRPQATVVAHPTNQDEDYVMAVYRHPNRGQHTVIGQAGFPQRLQGVPMIQRGDQWFIQYGFRGGGDVFLVHRRDIEVAPHLFQPQQKPVAPPAVPQERLAEPAPLQVPEEAEAGEIVEIELTEKPVHEPKKVDLTTVMDDDGAEPDVTAPPEPVALGGNGRDLDEPLDFQKLVGVTARLASLLEREGVNTPAQVLELGEKGLKAFKGIGDARARIILKGVEKMAAST